MACGGCGGSRKAKPQKYLKPQIKPTIQIQNKIQTPIKIQNSNKIQTLRNDRCPKCNSTVMLVQIAGRERRQCTNYNCRYILIK